MLIWSCSAVLRLCFAPSEIICIVFGVESLSLQHCSVSTHTHPHTELTQHSCSSWDQGETEYSAGQAWPELCLFVFYSVPVTALPHYQGPLTQNSHINIGISVVQYHMTCESGFYEVCRIRCDLFCRNKSPDAHIQQLSYTYW